MSAIKWSQTGSVLLGCVGEQRPSGRIAAFDFDGTLSNVRGSHTHPKNADDWQVFNTKVAPQIALLHNEGYRIVIFSNQRGIAEVKNQHRRDSFTGRVSRFYDAVMKDIPLIVFAATEDDYNRKPRPGMFALFNSNYNGQVQIDLKHSVYVGDAAGRPAHHSSRPNGKADFSDTDYKFAVNVSLPFHIPESFFAGVGSVSEKITSTLPVIAFCPKECLAQIESLKPQKSQKPQQAPTSYKFDSADENQPELVLLVGAPASGKSTFAKQHFVQKGYVRVNQDELKTRVRCLKVAESALREGKRVIIDNTNPSVEARARYIQIATKVGGDKQPIRVRCIHIWSEPALCQHNNFYRAYLANRKPDGSWAKHRDDPVKAVPAIAFRYYYSNFETPVTTEGFSEVLTVGFQPSFDGKHDDKAVWSQYLI